MVQSGEWLVLTGLDQFRDAYEAELLPLLLGQRSTNRDELTMLVMMRCTRHMSSGVPGRVFRVGPPARSTPAEEPAGEAAPEDGEGVPEGGDVWQPEPEASEEPAQLMLLKRYVLERRGELL